MRNHKYGDHDKDDSVILMRHTGVSIYRRRIIQIQRWVKRVMIMFNSRLTCLIISMNSASIKHKKEAALKRDLKATKKIAVESGKATSQPDQVSKAQTSDKGARRKSLVCFEDSKTDKQFYDTAFSMWNILDKFSRAKVCERALLKMYRSNRIAVKDYNTNLLPKWEAWKTAENIRDSVKFQMGDASRRKRWNDSGAMVAPEYPRIRFHAHLLWRVCCICGANLFDQVFCSVTKFTKTHWRHNFGGAACNYV